MFKKVSHITAYALTFFLLPQTAVAENGGAISQDSVLDASACPRIFGEPEDTDRNMKKRSQAVEAILRTRNGYQLLHHRGRWAEPSLMRVAGLQIKGTRHVADERQVLVSLDGPLSKICPKGVYAVSRDQSFGRQGQIIAITKDMVLVDTGSSLGVLNVAGKNLPRLESIWRSNYAVVAGGVSVKHGSSQTARIDSSVSRAGEGREASASASDRKAKAIQSARDLRPEIKPSAVVRPTAPKIRAPSK
jgi:hypothetical protein